MASLSTRKRTPLPIHGSDVRYVSAGRLSYLIYAVTGNVWGIRFDPTTLQVQGTSAVVLQGVSRATGAFTGTANFSLSDAGTLAYVSGPADSPKMNIALVDPAGKMKPQRLNAPADRYDSPRVSSDGATVAVGVEADKDTAAIYTIAASGGTGRQPLTELQSDSRYPAWTQDNRRIAFQSNRGGDLGIWWQAANGRDQPVQLTKAAGGEEHIPESWSADDTLLYSVTIGGLASLRTLTVRNGKPGPSQPFGREKSVDSMSAVISPNGKFVAYTRTDARDREITICVEPFPSEFISTCLEPHLADSPKHPRWSPDGARLYYDPRPPDFEYVDVLTEPGLHFGERHPVSYHPFRLAPPGFRTPYDIMRDGRFLGLIPAGQEEYIPNLPKKIVVVRNWFETLRQLIK